MTKITEIGKAKESEADTALRLALGMFKSCIVIGYTEEGRLGSTGTTDITTAEGVLMLETLKMSLLMGDGDE